jgi:hypothetical protein
VAAINVDRRSPILSDWQSTFMNASNELENGAPESKESEAVAAPESLFKSVEEEEGVP